MDSMINFSGTQINTVRGDVIIQGLTPSLSGIDPPIHLNLNPKLEAHLQEQFNYYERENIAVKTPQLLLMLLRYENCNILKVFNSLQIGTNRKYGDFLLTYFQAWNQHFQKNGISYEEKNFEDFLKVVKHGIQELKRELRQLDDEEYRDRWDSLELGEYIPAHTLCYFILTQENSQTLDEMRKQIGPFLDKLTSYIKINKVPTFTMR